MTGPYREGTGSTPKDTRWRKRIVLVLRLLSFPFRIALTLPLIAVCAFIGLPLVCGWCWASQSWPEKFDTVMDTSFRPIVWLWR